LGVAIEYMRPNDPEPKMAWWEGTAEIPGRIVGNSELSRNGFSEITNDGS